MIWLYIVLGIVLIFGLVVFRGAPYVPSHRRYVRQAFTKKLYEVTADDVLLDVGSGDGVVLRLAAARGAHAIGYEINPILVAISQLLARKNPRIETRLSDFWRTAFPDNTTVVYAFAVTRDMPKLATKMQYEADRLGRPLWLITYGADMPAKKPVKILQAHTLYEFEPLQEVQA
jgi:SAM-dependent methyltransferase